MQLLNQAKDRARRVKRDIVAVYLAGRDPETPALVRWLALGIAAYALSPIDLIPDFVPVLGYLDDLILVPAGIYLVVRLLPPHVLSAARSKAETLLDRPRSKAAAVFIACVWLSFLVLAILGYRYRYRR